MLVTFCIRELESMRIKLNNKECALRQQEGCRTVVIKLRGKVSMKDSDNRKQVKWVQENQLEDGN